jgi:hypothetical protein
MGGPVMGVRSCAGVATVCAAVKSQDWAHCLQACVLLLVSLWLVKLCIKAEVMYRGV